MRPSSRYEPLQLSQNALWSKHRSGQQECRHAAAAKGAMDNMHVSAGRPMFTEWLLSGIHMRVKMLVHCKHAHSQGCYHTGGGKSTATIPPSNNQPFSWQTPRCGWLPPPAGCCSPRGTARWPAAAALQPRRCRLGGSVLQAATAAEGEQRAHASTGSRTICTPQTELMCALHGARCQSGAGQTRPAGAHQGAQAHRRSMKA